MHECALLLRALADRVHTACLPSGAPLRNVGDFKEWLLLLSEKAEKANTLSQFLSGI